MAMPKDKTKPKKKKKSLLKVANLNSSDFRIFLEQQGMEPDSMSTKEKEKMFNEMMESLGLDPVY